MSIGAVSTANPNILQQARQTADQAPQQLQDFQSVLQSLDQQGTQQAGMEENLPALDLSKIDFQQVEVNLPSDVEGAYADQVGRVQEPGGAEKLLAEAQDKYARLDELLSELDGGRSFSPEELIGVQNEVHQITFELDVTSKVIGQVVSGVKTLMQQQI